MKITKDTIIAEILKTVPGSKDVFDKHNMGCYTCMGVQKESLEKGCLMHGKDVEEVLKEIEQLSK